MPLTWDTSVRELPGVGEAREKILNKLGIACVGDLLIHYPRAYEDRTRICGISDAPVGQRVCVAALAAEHPRRALLRKGMELVQLRVVDGGGTLYLTFFNQGYVQKLLRAGREYIFCGVIEEQGRRRTMANPLFEEVGKGERTGRIVPLYPLTAGITNHALMALTQRVLPCAEQAADPLPAPLREEYGLAGLPQALEHIHFPPSQEELEEARRRLAFEELLLLSLGLERLKYRRTEGTAQRLTGGARGEFLNLLPFSPTEAQQRVMEEVAADLAAGTPMNRLVQGDVGSGKTLIAAYAAWLAARGGCQAAMMAPTEVLAEQHYRTLSALLGPAGVRVGLLTGTLSAPRKREVRRGLAEGTLDFVVGTHALLTQGVEFARLALAVTDEQHRFGVGQRAMLAAKAGGEETEAPHVLVLSATPIPRTLALIIYGDLEVSVIDQLPPGRTPVATYVAREHKRKGMLDFVARLVEEGRQAYIICPAIEDAQQGEEAPGALDLKGVKAYAKHLAEEVFPHLRVGLLHGKMRPGEKEAAMGAFTRGETQVLVSTTVVEVGVDVPNAAVMVVENAERFGLSQLHQLRGRVGRGAHQSYCILMTDTRNPDTLARLKTLASTTDGFRIAEEDLKQRGPGDFFGNRQHGLPQLRLADLAGDMRTLSQAQQAARRLTQEDPGLRKPEHGALRERVRRLFTQTPDMFN